MINEKIHATARVRVTVVVPTSSWGAQCTVEQVVRQASEEAKNKVSKAMHGIGCVVGEPLVTVVIGEESQ